MFYLVGTPKGRIDKHEKKWLDLPWQQVRESVQVKLYRHEVLSLWYSGSGGKIVRPDTQPVSRAGRPVWTALELGAQ